MASPGVSCRNQGYEMADRSAYDRTTIDWDRLRRYAKRVARETSLSLSDTIEYTVRTHETVTSTERRRGGFLGLGTPRQVKVSQVQPVSKSFTVVGPHWVLSQRSWHHDEKRHHDGMTIQEETHSQTYLLLLPNGNLQSAWKQETSTMQWGSRIRSGLLHSETTHNCGDPTDNDICKLDFERYYREWKQREGNIEHHYWMDRDPGRKLLKHAKGVGVNLALKAILEGRRPTGT